MARSAGFRFFVVGLLALLMFIPLFFVSEVVNDRKRYSEATIDDVGREWGGEQLLSGPQLVIPVTEDVTTQKRRDLIDPATGQPQRDANDRVMYEYYEETVTESRAPVYMYPGDFTARLSTATQERRRGIFVVPVYVADLDMQFDFPLDAAEAQLTGNEVLHWDQAELRVFMTSNRALRGEAALSANGSPLALEPLPSSSHAPGVVAQTGDPRGQVGYSLWLGLNGAQSLQATAVGRNTRVEMASDWPHPSFFGDFLPDSSEISDTGFTATWTIPHLARNLAQVSREDPDQTARYQATFGVRFFQPNDFYQKSFRAARYGILFIALTFLTVLLLDRSGEKPTHPVQYIFIGLAQSVFVLLMVAYAEQIGFGWSYLLSSAATIALLTMFGALALKLGRRVGVLTISLIILYGVLYLILRSADYALLAGSTLAFLALAGTMYLTRNEDWHGPERPARERRGFWGGRPPQSSPAETAPPQQ